jgi:hypothetical protein
MFFDEEIYYIITSEYDDIDKIKAIGTSFNKRLQESRQYVRDDNYDKCLKQISGFMRKSNKLANMAISRTEKEENIFLKPDAFKLYVENYAPELYKLIEW